MRDYATRCAPGTTASTSTSKRPSGSPGPSGCESGALLRAARHGFDVGYTAVYQIKGAGRCVT